MQSFNIIKEINPTKTFRVASIIDRFDLQTNKVTETFKGEIDLDFDWKVGIIFGHSGTGKTLITKELFKQNITDYKFEKESIIDDMPTTCTIEDISKTFSSVGFSSPPSWLKPYKVLSEGEKMRVNLARALLEEPELIVFDEFTSVVDRNVAKTTSFAIQKSIRKSKKKFIAVTCHEDVIDWLQADWIFNTNTMEFIKNPEKKNLNLISKYTNAQEIYGECLVNITI